jgi:hypothetical protein
MADTRLVYLEAAEALAEAAGNVQGFAEKLSTLSGALAEWWHLAPDDRHLSKMLEGDALRKQQVLEWSAWQDSAQLKTFLESLQSKRKAAEEAWREIPEWARVGLRSPDEVMGRSA